MSNIVTINPATLLPLGQYAYHTDSQIQDMLKNSSECFKEYRKLAISERAHCMMCMAALLEEKRETLAACIITEMGKVRSEALSEINKCAWVCRYYAEYAEGVLAAEEITTDAKRSYVSYRQLGTLLAVMPWNFPFWQVFRVLAPNLMAGNVMLL